MDDYCAVHDIECAKIKDLEIEMKKMVTLKLLVILISLFSIVIGGIFGVLSTQINVSNDSLHQISERQHVFNTRQSLIMYKLDIKDKD